MSVGVNRAARWWRTLLLSLLAGLVFVPSMLHAQTISFTFDDGLDPRTNKQAAAQNAAILQALDAAKVRAVFFPAGKNVDSPEGLALVRAWGAAGHAIGNHTYSHASYGSKRMTLEAFTQDIQRQHDLLSSLPGWTNRLRFPYLKEGDTAAKHDAIYQWLRAHDYRPGAVSIDASDWYYSERHEARLKANPAADLAPMRQAYLDHLWDRANYYDGLAMRTVGRHPAHVILLHTNAVNAAFLPDVIAMFRRRGWTIVDAQTAFDDPLYRLRPGTIPAGESILWSLAKEQGVPGLRYPAEDGEYEQAKLDALGL